MLRREPPLDALLPLGAVRLWLRRCVTVDVWVVEWRWQWLSKSLTQNLAAAMAQRLQGVVCGEGKVGRSRSETATKPIKSRVSLK